ncbi:MAG: hypothetical protein IT328_13150 [Caldilineaceae bacterium]|nr:hypothetical protein [Caldilineaceae bacterium]
MTTNWDQHAGETEEWYDRFRIYLYMGPDRTLAAAHSFATRLAKGAAHGQLSSWRRAAQRSQWQARAAAYDAELCRQALAGNERLLMVAELLHQVYGVLRHADIATLSKEEARQLLPTFRLFFRDLLHFHQTAAAQMLTAKEGESKGGGVKPGAELSADDLVKFLTEAGGWQTLLAEIDRATETTASETAWRPLRDVLAHFYPDEASARRMAAQAHLDSARIHFSARAVDTWHAILTEAAHAGHLEHLINAVQQEYAANPELAQAVRRYRQSQPQARKVKIRRKA